MRDRELRLTILGIAVLIVISIAGVLARMAAASAHDWYPADCCSGCDCRPVAAEDVRVTAGGWLVEATGEVIGFADAKLKPSRGGGFHRCSPAFCKAGAGDRTICLFTPGMGS